MYPTVGTNEQGVLGKLREAGCSGQGGRAVAMQEERQLFVTAALSK